MTAPAKEEAQAPEQQPAPVAENKQEASQTSPDEKAEADPAAPEAQADGEAEAEADEALSKSTSLTPEQQAIIDKRIGKAVAKQRRAERDTAELKLKLAELESRQAAPAQQQNQQEQPSIVPLPSGVSPLANIDSVQGLVKLEQEAKQAIRFAEDAIEEIRDGGQPPEGWTKQSLREVLRNARVTLEDQIPQRRDFLSARNQMQQRAYEVLPFMKDQASSDYKAAQAIYQRHPFLRNIPEGDFTVGLIVEGIKAVEARTAAAGKTAATPAKTPANKAVISKPVASSDQSAVSASDGNVGRVPSGTSRDRALAAERTKLAEKRGVSQGDYAAHLSRQSQLRKSS